MMSYASDGGGAGPHYDNYDVFIIQGEGRRTWELGQRCDDQSPLQADTDMRILAQFRGQRSHTLECGDVLYIPPGVAHRGVSHGDSTSFSLGFRAPRLSDLLARWADNTLADTGDALLLQDAGRAPAGHAGEITREDVQRARRQLLALANDDDPRWFGEALTEQQVEQEGGSSIAGTVQGCTLALAPGARLAWYRGEDHLLVFAGGQTQRAHLALQPVLEALCSGDAIEASAPGSEAEGLEALLQWLQDTNTLVSFDDE
jgi:50S ribosomal protein L16 3-hydroxylase